jgi:cysteine desulfurase
MKELFLDANAHLPICKPAMDAFIKSNSSLEGHGHALAPSAPGRQAEAAIELARKEIADLLGAEYPAQIIFTSTCTEACSWGMKIFEKMNEGRPVYMSPTEHSAMRQAAKESIPKRVLLSTNGSGMIDLEYPIPSESAVISIHVQNEIGIIQPATQLKCSSLFLDMSQTPGKIKMPKLKDIHNLDVAVFGAHKFGGPASVGILYLKDTDKWVSNSTGSRYFLDRPGTPDVPSIAASAAALKHAYETLDERMKNMIEFKAELEPGLESLGFEIIGKDCSRAPGTTFARLPEGQYSQILMQQLSWKKIYIGLGSACGSVHSGTSPLMKILSRGGSVRDFIRISHYGEYFKGDAKYFIDTLKGVM